MGPGLLNSFNSEKTGMDEDKIMNINYEVHPDHFQIEGMALLSHDPQNGALVIYGLRLFLS